MTVVELSAKDRLIRAAEELFAQKGIEATSFREIAVLAGQKNKNAVQYHFKDKRGLITAIWQRHAAVTEEKRNVFLQTVDNPAEMDIDTLVASIIEPLTAKLDDADGGRHYLQVMSKLINYADASMIELFDYIPDITNDKVMNDISPYTQHLSDEDRVARMILIAGMIFHGLADYIRLTEANPDFSLLLSQETYVKNLKLMVKGAFLASS